MSPLLKLASAAMLIAALSAAPRDSRRVYELIKEGGAMSPADAATLEQQVDKKPNDEEARIRLLAHYVKPPAGADLAAVRAARAKHILWMIENDPKDGMDLFQGVSRIYRINCRGD